MPLYHKVQCWIFSHNQKNQIQCLLLQTNIKRGSFWQPVTGRVESNESNLEAACREAYEETKLSFLTPFQDTSYEFKFSSRYEKKIIEHVFVCYTPNTPTPQLDPKEHEAYQWLPPKQAVKFLRYPSNIDGLKQAYTLLFKKEL